ncbi:glucoamylase family protein [Rosistilla oblonga]|uniref:glucoamylase family protein n=1 Tax=Rosistilla oblonga TaxID=2527990 RepID=UPI003A97B2D4
MKRRSFLFVSGLSLPPLVQAANVDVVAREDGLFLRDMQQRCYRYFLEASHPATGLVSDRSAADGSRASEHSSIAACGFGLAAHAIAADQEWLPRGEIAERVEVLLRTLVERADHERGFLYHFLNRADARRTWNSEASTIDTALVVAGAMTAAGCFSEERSIVALADALYRRVEWTWMLGSDDCLHMGWTPEDGTIPHRWDHFSELLILVLLAIGAPENPIPPRCWQAWNRRPILTFGDTSFLSYPPLFVHQYPAAFFDFRRFRSPSGRSYFDNAVIAHQAQIQFMTDLGNKYADQLGHYGPRLWGLTSSDSDAGYRDWGGPYQDGRCEPDRGIDGTLVPSAAAGGLPFVPRQAMETLRYQESQFGDAIYGRYGFVNAHNPASGWIDSDVIGIDTGISLLMAENLISGSVWDWFGRHPAAIRGLRLAGFSRDEQID